MSMTLIQTVTVGSGGASEILFSLIPATFTDLVVVFSGRSTTASTFAQYGLQLNGTTTGYSERVLLGTDGSTASASTSQAQFQFNYIVGASSTSNTFNNDQWYFPNYLSAAAKSVSYDGVTENNASTGYVTSIAAKLWNNTNAINSVRLFSLVNLFAQHSSASLYGILAGSSGGVIVS